MTEFEIIEKYSMSRTEALDIIKQEAESLGLPLLETLIYMDENMHEYGSVEKCAYRITFRNFQQLFAPKEAV